MRGHVPAVRLAALPLLAALALPAAAQQGAVYLPDPGTGVSVRLSNEREITGTFIGERDGAVWLGVDGGEVGLDPSDIVLVRKQENDDTEFRRRAARLGRDAAGWWSLAQWAQQRGLPGSADEAARRVVELAPDHPGARQLLGQEKVGGAWLEEDAAMKAKGYVYHQGDWIKREEWERIEQGRREARQEERLDRFLALEEAKAYAPRPAAAYPYPAYNPWWWEVPEMDQNGKRGRHRYTVPIPRDQPFQQHFHEGYFRRAGF
jgi:hypothetical protein